MTHLWTSDDAVKATGGRATSDWQVSGVSIDTRSLQPGDLFVALKAARDGHDFVAQALENGAGAALVSRIPEGLPEDAPLLVVDDVLTGLEDLGMAARHRTRAKVVAVTGSVGKTSTKEMLRTVLGAQGTVHAAEKSYNNHWGVPLTLARMPQDVDFAVIEIGMNHPGEIAPLAKMARPNVALITIVAPAHLAAFESLAGIAEEKASIYQGLEPGGVAVLNGDLEVSDILASEAKRHAETVLSFGQSANVEFRATGVSIRDDCTVVQGQTQGVPVLYKVPVPGRHYAINAMGVLATVAALDLDQALAVAALGRWGPGEGRGAREEIVLDMANAEARFELIDDAYNANPASLAASLEVLAAAETGARAGLAGRGRRVAYIGDMKELGATEAELHRAVADLAAVQNIDVIHCVGPLMQHLYQALPEGKRGRWAETSAEITQGIGQDINAGDVVLVKGSLSMALARVVDALKKMGQAPVKLDG